MRCLVLLGLPVAFAMSYAWASPNAAHAPAASAPLVKPQSRVVPQTLATQRKPASANDELRALLKAQTEAIHDLSSRLDEMDRRLNQLEKRDR